MNTRAVQAIGASLAIVALGGCTAGQDYFDHSAVALGEATRQTLAAQIINPNPEYDTLIPATSGEHAVGAIDRYREGTVEQPERQQTSSVGSSGSGGN
jgi:hypothetical protein